MPKIGVCLGCLIVVNGLLFVGIPEVRAQVASESGPSGILQQTASSAPASAPKSDLEKQQTEEKTIRVTPIEDLNGEHGAVDRILLILDEIVRRLEKQEPLPPETIVKTVEIIRSFIQEHHEMLEDKYLFPRFPKGGKFADLINILAQQHAVGRKIIDNVATLEKMKDSGEREKVANSLRGFARMYRAHKSREDTVILPAFHALVPSPEYEELGDEFERLEEKLFGKGGFGKILDRVEALERMLGIVELAQFSPDPF